MLRPETRYASAGSATIAYQVLGDGPVDLLYVPGWFFNPEVWREFAPIRRYLERLVSFCRIVTVEKRGFGMSDRVSLERLPTVEERVADISAVADDAGLARTAVMGAFEGGTLALLWAAANPSRVSAVVVVESFARLDWTKSIFAALGEDEAGAARRVWDTFASGRIASLFFPDLPLTPAQERQVGRGVRLSANPSVIQAWLRMVFELDARAALNRIAVPVLVVHHDQDQILDVEHGRLLAESLPDARYVEITGRDHVPWGRDFDLIMGEVEEFLTGRPPRRDSGVRQTIMFTDIVASTPRVAEMGDKAWRSLLEAHDQVAIDLLDRYGGRLVKATGDGLLSQLPNPLAAVDCAKALVAELHDIGLDIRVGIHTGECEPYGEDLVGLAVNVAARVMAEAAPGEILVSDAVRELGGGGLTAFQDRGERRLRGIPGLWRLHSVS